MRDQSLEDTELNVMPVHDVCVCVCNLICVVVALFICDGGSYRISVNCMCYSHSVNTGPCFAAL